MPGTGYNIPISVSYARTDTVNPILNASTSIIFDSPWASGGNNDQTSRLADSATATSSAAEGNASAATQASNAVVDGGDTTGSKTPIWVYVSIGVSLVSIGLFIYYAKKR